MPINTSSSSSSSSSGQDYASEGLTYCCDCMGVQSICNPVTGKASGMAYRGFFDYLGSVSHGGSPHVPHGALEKNQANRGMFFCADAGRLFSMASGGVRITLVLPWDIVDGVYQPLASSSGADIDDYVVWSAGMGEVYISQPGLYAALTPYGIEFTVWSSNGRFTVVDTSTTCFAGEEITLGFFWKPSHLSSGGNISIYADDILAAKEGAVIADNSLTGLYEIVGESSTVAKNVEFTALDSPFSNHGLNCTVTRLETYSAPPARYTSNVLSSSSSSSSTTTSSSVMSGESSSSSMGDESREARLTVPFTFFSGGGPKVMITSVEAATVSRRKIGLNSGGSFGSAIDKGGNDNGAVSGTDPLPTVPPDLPPGILEVEDLSS